MIDSEKQVELEVNKENIFRAALLRWGMLAQLDMVIEESSELIQAMCHYKRHPNTIENVEKLIEEVADVQICIDQLIDILLPKLGVPNASKILLKKLYEKLERLEKDVYG